MTMPQAAADLHGVVKEMKYTIDTVKGAELGHRNREQERPNGADYE